MMIFFQAFHDVAYCADSREELLEAINEFLVDTVVLPPGNWDRSVLLPILIAQSRAIAIRRKMAKAGKNVTHWAVFFSVMTTMQPCQNVLAADNFTLCSKLFAS